MRKLRIFIAGPIVNGDLRENIERANAAYFELVENRFAPYCPHWSCFSGRVNLWSSDPKRVYFALAETLPRDSRVEDWYAVCLSFVEVCDAVLRLPGEGKGSDGEVEYARQRGIPVFYSVDELAAWRDSLDARVADAESRHRT